MDIRCNRETGDDTTNKYRKATFFTQLLHLFYQIMFEGHTSIWRNIKFLNEFAGALEHLQPDPLLFP